MADCRNFYFNNNPKKIYISKHLRFWRFRRILRPLRHSAASKTEVRTMLLRPQLRGRTMPLNVYMRFGNILYYIWKEELIFIFSTSSLNIYWVFVILHIWKEKIKKRKKIPSKRKKEYRSIYTTFLCAKKNDFIFFLHYFITTVSAYMKIYKNDN